MGGGLFISGSIGNDFVHSAMTIPKVKVSQPTELVEHHPMLYLYPQWHTCFWLKKKTHIHGPTRKNKGWTARIHYGVSRNHFLSTCNNSLLYVTNTFTVINIYICIYMYYNYISTISIYIYYINLHHICISLYI